jgi:hypothetical protein
VTLGFVLVVGGLFVRVNSREPAVAERGELAARQR